MGNKFPRPADINFPNVQDRIDYKFPEISRIDGTKGKEIKVGLSVCALKSGNILISYIYKDISKLEVKSCLAIYSVPNLKLIQKYVFNSEIEDLTFIIDSAIQLINGNIFAICDKLYIFDGESISDGPKTTSGEIDDSSFYQDSIVFPDPKDRFQIRTIKKSARVFSCDFMFEAKEGIILFTYHRNPIWINLLDIGNLETKEEKVFAHRRSERECYEMSIIKKSEFHPDNLYVVANNIIKRDLSDVIKKTEMSALLVFNLDDFCDKNKKQKNPLFTISISNSENVYGMCEYNEKYLLLDTINKGIYIIDIESKQKVAVSATQLYFGNLNKIENFLVGSHNKKIDLVLNNRYGPIYRDMIKLKDGQVLVVHSQDKSGLSTGFDSSFCIADIVGQTKKYMVGCSGRFVLSGNYIISFEPSARLLAYQLYES